MYSLTDFVWMLADERRHDAYARAIHAAVTPGCRVLELGCGFGYFSIVAAQAGAAHVDAVDINPAVHVGTRVAAVNGCSDRVHFHQIDARQFVAPQPYDVIVGDLRGPLPFASRGIEVMLDARRRLLKDGGAIIARRDVVYCAPVGPLASLASLTGVAFNRSVDLRPVRRVIGDTPARCRIEPGEVLAAAVPWTSVDYLTGESPNASATLEWRFEERAEVHGFGVWFEADLGAGISMSTAPESGKSVYSQFVIPLERPLEVAKGERLIGAIAAVLSGGEYVWSWNVQVLDPSGRRRAGVSQNSIAEHVIDPAAHTVLAKM